MTGPLTGLRVLDLGTRIAAPFSAGVLGEQGAEVIKIEQPGTGDFMREIGPFVDDGVEDSPGYSLFWAVEGRGRKSVTLNLRTAEGQDLFRRLAATADVVVENFRPGTLEKWNIAPADLDERLVTVRISTFGQDGPYSQRPGLDRLGIGYGGLLHLTGYPDRPPVRVGVTISDYMTGVFAAQAATAALYSRDVHRNGRGAVVDAALYGSALRVLEWTIAAYDQLGTVRSREGNRLANSAPLDNYPTGDGKYVCIVAGSDTNFARLCKAMQRPDLAEDPKYARLADRAAAQRRDQRDRGRLDAVSHRDRARGLVRAVRRPRCDRVHRGRHVRRPPLRRPRRPPAGRRPGRGANAPAGALPALRRRARRRADRCAPAGRAHRRGARDAPRPRARGARDPAHSGGRVNRPVNDGMYQVDPPGLLGTRCDDCLHPSFPRTTTCPYCGSVSVTDIVLSAEGALWAWTEVTAPPPGYQGDVPYGFGVVQLPEGLRVITRLGGDQDDFAVGLPMTMHVVPLHTEDDGTVVETWEFAP